MVTDALTHADRENGALQDASTELLPQAANGGVCRACGGILHRFINLEMSPLCDRLLRPDQLHSAETFYPLELKICERCWLAQHHAYVAPTHVFREYAYTSSVSESCLADARAYVEDAVGRFHLGPHSFVVEVGSNDGYLLRNVMERGIPCCGIEPATIAATQADRVGVPTIREFFTRELAATLVERWMSADLIVANNVLAELSDLNDFAAGVATLLKPDGIATIEVSHLMRLIERNEFDTMYHENLWYFSLHSFEYLLAPHGLRVFDVEELSTQGGSLRVFCCATGSHRAESPAVMRVRLEEIAAGVRDLGAYRAFEAKVIETKRKLLELLLKLKRKGDRIVGYGAPGKGNMLLNYCGIRSDILDFTVDRNPYKHGHYLPGTRIRVEPVERLYESRPDWVLILPWNFEQEIVAQLQPLRELGTKFIVPIPEPRIVE
jgi:hypothetical protein